MSISARNDGSFDAASKQRRSYSTFPVSALPALCVTLSPQATILHIAPPTLTKNTFDVTPLQLINESLTTFLHVDDIEIFIRSFEREMKVSSAQEPFSCYLRIRPKNGVRYAVLHLRGRCVEFVPPPFNNNSSLKSEFIQNEGKGGGNKLFFGTLSSKRMDDKLDVLDEILELRAEEAWLLAKKTALEMELSSLEQELQPLSDQTYGPESGGFKGFDEELKRKIRKNDAFPSFSSMPTEAPAMGGGGGDVDMNFNLFSTPSSLSTAVAPLSTTISSAAAAAATVAAAAAQRSTTTAQNTAAAGENNSRNPQMPMFFSDSCPHPFSNAMSLDTVTAREGGGVNLASLHEHVCTECGTVESPEWRKGPLGPKTYVSKSIY